MQKLVSVCLYSCNSEEYIQTAIQSLINQTYSNIEVVIVDDCSTDTSLEIIRSFDENRIKVICNREQSGLYASRITAFDNCSGDYIAMMDVEDIAAAERVSKQVDELEAGFDFCGGWACFIDNDSEEKLKQYLTKSELQPDRKVNGHILKRHESKAAAQAQLLFEQPVIDGTVMFSKVFLDIVGDFYTTDDGNIADSLLWYRLLLKRGVRFKNLQEILIYCRKDKLSQYNSWSSQHNEKYQIVRGLLFSEMGVLNHQGKLIHDQLYHGIYPDKKDAATLSDFYQQIVLWNENNQLFEHSALKSQLQLFIDNTKERLLDDPKKGVPISLDGRKKSFFLKWLR